MGKKCTIMAVAHMFYNVIGESVLIETQKKLKNAELMTDEPEIFLASEILYKAHYLLHFA